MRQYDTYTPDSKKNFDGKILGSICSLKSCPEFTYPELIKHTVRYIDVLWFNERGFPDSAFEVEHSTDIRGALTKFCDLQDFTTRFFVVIPANRKDKYDNEIKRAAFNSIQSRCLCRTYNQVKNYYDKLLGYSKVREIF